MKKETERKIYDALDAHAKSLSLLVDAIETAVDEKGEATFTHYDDCSVETWSVKRVNDDTSNLDDCDYVIINAEGKEVSTLEDSDSNMLFDICSTLNQDEELKPKRKWNLTSTTKTMRG